MIKISGEIENRLSAVFNERVFIKSNKILSGGCIANSFRIETNLGDFFIKWSNSGSSESFIREAQGLEALRIASKDSIIIPRVLAVNNISDEFGFIVLEFIESDNSIKANDEKLGRGLAEIHKCSSKRFGFETNNFCGTTLQINKWKDNWCEFLTENRFQHLLTEIEKKGKLSNDNLKIFDKFLMKIPELITTDTIPSLIHGDLWSGNYLSTKNGAVLIDPAVSYSDREMEFGMITLFGGFSTRFFDSYNEIWSLSEDWKGRNSIYQMYHILNHFYLFGGNYLVQALQIARHYTE